MKKIFLFTILFSALSCEGQKLTKVLNKSDTLTKKAISMYYTPNVNSNFEKFDFQKTKEKYLQDLKKRGDLQNPKANAYSYNYTEKIEDGKTIYRDYFEVRNKKNIKEFGESYPLEVIYDDNSPFAIKKTFYPNGNIKEKGLFIVSGNFYKGIWYYFDESGKLIHTIDNDKLFGFSWEEVEKFMTENKISMPLGNAYVHGKTIIERSSTLLYPKSSERDVPQKSLKAWEITWKGEERNQYYSVTLDGDSGKILYKKKYWAEEEPGDNVPEPIIEDFTKDTTQIYKTYQGKSYTQSEWKAFEQEQYNEHLSKTGRADLIKSTETPKTETKRKGSFLADEDDVKPKKKGFWG